MSIVNAMRAGMSMVLVLIMSGCGGGGGGVAAPTGPSLSANFDPAEVRITARKGEVGAGKTTVRISVDPSFTGGISIGARGGEALLSDFEVVQIGADVAEVTLLSRPDLPPGTYTDSIEIQFCQDAVCEKPLRGGPFTLALAVTVTPILELPSSIVLVRAPGAPLPTSDVPIVLPEPGIQLVVEEVDRLIPEGLVTARLQNGVLSVTVLEAPPGQYDLPIRVRSEDNRYQATTVVSYQVQADGSADQMFSVSEPAVTLNALQGQLTRARVAVTLPAWASQAELISRVASVPAFDARLTLVRLAPDQFELEFDTANLELDSAAVMLEFGSLKFPSYAARVNLTLTVDAAVLVDAATVEMTSLAPIGGLSASAAVRMANGSAATWTVNPTALPKGVTVVSTQGVAGVDPIRYLVDPSTYGPGTVAIDVPLSVDAQGVLPTVSRLLIDDRLPRLMELAGPPVEARPGQNFVFVKGYFPEDVVANGRLESFGASRISVMVTQPNLLKLVVTDPQPGVPISLRLRYPAYTSFVEVPITSVVSATAIQSWSLPFAIRRPPVYSQRSHAYYFASDGVLHRIANVAGIWVHSTRQVPGLLQVELTPKHDRLLALTPGAIENIDPDTLELAAPYRRLDAGEVSPEIATSFNKHLVTLIDGRMAWATTGTACAGSAQIAPIADAAAPSQTRTLACNGTTSLGAVYSNTTKTALTVYQNDRAKQPITERLEVNDVFTWSSGLGSFRGITGDDGDLIVTGDGTVSILGFFPGDPGPGAAIPAGHVGAGYAMGLQSNFWAYAYKVAAANGSVSATEPKLVEIRRNPTMFTPAVRTIALPAAVGCQPGRPVGEPCDHRAHVLMDQSGAHVLVLGPQTAQIVPTALLPTSDGGSGSVSIERARPLSKSSVRPNPRSAKAPVVR